jgi:hypothetical protein
MPRTTTPPRLRDRILDLRRIPARDLQDHQMNWRTHPQAQQDAMRGVLDELGIAAALLVYDSPRQGGLCIIDGHLRKSLDPSQAWPCLVLDLDDDEAAYLLATHDPLGAMAEASREAVARLLEDVHSGQAAVQQLLSDLASDAGLLRALGETDPGGVAPALPTVSLAERFLVPPFSVLDARQGYWQARKRAWLALGIQSELGRGEGVTPGDSPAMTEATLNHYRKQNGLLGESQQARSHYAAPGHSLRDATSLGKDGHTLRGNGAGKPLARTEGSGAPGELAAGYNAQRLTWVPGDREDLDETSRKILAAGRHTAATAALMDLAGGESASHQSGTSIFDPVLCELAYRWFCPPTGAILDPFAGGSVRGLVAARLGRAYTGIDLRPEQVAANAAQWQRIGQEPEPSVREVTISAAMARLPFHGCEPDYIATVCHASCCRSSTKKGGTFITVHPSEVDRLARHGVVIAEGLLQPQPGSRTCPFQTPTHLCGLHETPDKPFGCIASPFTLTGNDTLIIRNRYKLLKCYKDGNPPLPAYIAFRASLDYLFGAEEAARIAAHLDAGGGDMPAVLPAVAWRMLHDNDAIKKAETPGTGAGTAPQWLVGDSREMDALLPATPAYDLVFTCPPYADLERYSDDPRDLSTLPYTDFLAAYRSILAASVARLRDDRFAVLVVGDVRDSEGYYRNFISDTISAMQDAGARLYNEAILVTALGSLPLRAGIPFTTTRKLGKTHQQVLVFVKGDPRRATAACGPVGIDDALQAVQATAEEG